MRNNHFIKTQLLLAALAAALLAPVSVIAQQKTSARSTTIKDSDIYVPDAVLEPSYTRKEATELLKEYIEAFNDVDMPASYEVFAKHPDKYKRIGTHQLQAAMGNLFNFVKDPDLLEVTEVTEKWYKELYNKALELKEPAKQMDEAIRLKKAADYTKALQNYKAKYEELKKFASKKGERIPADKLKAIVEANKAKRKAEFIALRKKEMIEEEEAALKAIAEDEKKSSNKKK